VTRSYVAGTHNALAACGDNRDGTKGKRPMVIAFLCDEDGQPVSIEVFPGHPPAPRTVAAPVATRKGRCGVTALTFVGARGMRKSQQVEDVGQPGFHDMTAMTHPQIDHRRRTGTWHMDRFDQEVAAGLPEEGLRDVRRRHPVRAQAMRATRHANLATLQAHGATPPHSLSDPPRAHVQRAWQTLVARATPLRLSDGVELTVEERTRTRTVKTSAQPEAATLEGCSGLKTDLPPAPAPTELVHDRSTARASVAQAFRACTTLHLAVRPLCLRRAARTRAQAGVVMLADQLMRSLASGWSTCEITVEAGLHALTTLCLVDVSPTHAPSSACLPTPHDTIAHFLHRADITLPKAFALSGVRVSTRKKLQSARIPQYIPLLT
jgi:hypothetical protein